MTAKNGRLYQGTRSPIMHCRIMYLIIHGLHPLYHRRSFDGAESRRIKIFDKQELYSTNDDLISIVPSSCFPCYSQGRLFQTKDLVSPSRQLLMARSCARLPWQYRKRSAVILRLQKWLAKRSRYEYGERWRVLEPLTAKGIEIGFSKDRTRRGVLWVVRKWHFGPFQVLQL